MRVRAIIIHDNKILLGLNQDDMYVLVGGKIKEGEHPVDALLREVEEETGITDWLDCKYLWEHFGNHVFTIRPKLASNVEYPNPTKDPDMEFSTFGWFSLDSLPDNLEDLSEDVLFKYMRHNKFGDRLDDQRITVGNKVDTDGHIEVLIDGKKVFELRDDTIWETLPRLAQERSKGKKLEFRQILPDGTAIDQSPVAMPFTACTNKSYREYMASHGEFWKSNILVIAHKEETTYITYDHTNFWLIEKGIPVFKATNPEDLCDSDFKIVQAEWEKSKQIDFAYKFLEMFFDKYIPEEKIIPTIEIVYDTKKWLGKTIWDKKKTTIQLSDRLLGNLNLLKQVLSHEAIHHHLYTKFGTEVTKHGEHFQMIADKVNEIEGDNYITTYANDTDFKVNHL